MYIHINVFPKREGKAGIPWGLDSDTGQDLRNSERNYV